MNAKNGFDILKNDYNLKKIFNNLNIVKKFKIILYNKTLQKRLNINRNDYKEYTNIVFEIFPIENKYGNFINICNSEYESYYHFYFDDNKEEIKRHYITKEDKVKVIKIIINCEIKSLNGLFNNIENIYKINFIKFKRKDIKNMSFLFRDCSLLQELNFYEFHTNNVTNMSNMFCKCSSLKELNLSFFNTSNVTNMFNMFSNCSSLENLDLSNFNTKNVINMSYMFSGCSSLKVVDLSNFQVNNQTDIDYMFFYCGSLIKVICSDELIRKESRKKLKNVNFV